MGVKDLWQLLAPVGRRVSIETLEGKIVAIDMSIWLTQFIKAMRDEDGKMMKNAHIIGTLRRILKLLYHRIRPVFVFDGATPLLKQRVIQLRRKTHEKSEQNRRAAVHRLLLAQLKQQITKQATIGAEQETTQNFSSLFKPATTANNNNNNSSSNSNQATSGGSSSSRVNYLVNNSLPSTASQYAAEDSQELFEWTDGSELSKKKHIQEEETESEDEDGPMWTLPENNDQLDVEVLTSLPIHIRKRIIEDAKRRERARSRATFMPVADNPILYSQTQLANFLQASTLNRRFDEAHKKLEGEIRQEGKKIAAENKRYQFISRNINDSPSDSETSPQMKTGRKLVKRYDMVSKADESDDDFTFIQQDSTATTKKRISFEDEHDMMDDDKNENSEPSKIRHRFFDDLDEEDDEFVCNGSKRIMISSTKPNGEMIIDLLENATKVNVPTHDQHRNESEFECQEYVDNVDEQDDGYGHGGGFLVEEDIDTKSVSNPSTNEAFTSVEEVSSSHVVVPLDDVTDSNSNFRESTQKISQVEELKNILWEDDEDVIENISWESDTLNENDKTKSYSDDGEDDSSSDLEGSDLVEPQNIIVNLVGDAKPVEINVQSAITPKEIISLLDSKDIADRLPKITINLNEDDIITKKVSFASDLHDSSTAADILQESKTLSGQQQSSTALTRAISTASNMADWAGRVVRRVVKEHMEQQQSASTATIEAVSAARDTSGNKMLSVPTVPITTAGVVDNIKAIMPDELNDSAVAISKKPPSEQNVVDLSMEKETQKDIDMIQDDDHNEMATSILHQDIDDIDKTKKSLATSARDAERVTEDMKMEVLKLIQAFDLPFIVAPFEAEAQCAVLEEMGLVDGVVTEDSDSLLFGAKAVYKNIFSDRKFVEAYYAEDIQREMGLTRQDLIALAFFLGSDYTEGVHGVGIVNAMEIIQAFSMRSEEDGPMGGLKKFRQWMEGYDFAKDVLSTIQQKPKTSNASREGKAKKNNSKRTQGKEKVLQFAEVEAFSDSSDSEEDMDEDAPPQSSLPKTGNDLSEADQRMVDFEVKHKNARSKWVISANFPDESVIKAYLHPETNRNSEPFPFIPPARSKVRRFIAETLGWTDAQLNVQVDPVLERYADRSVQTRVDSFYSVKYQDDARFAKIASERLKGAVEKITGQDSSHLALQRQLSPKVSRKRNSSETVSEDANEEEKKKKKSKNSK